jgi:hypothetical protein
MDQDISSLRIPIVFLSPSAKDSSNPETNKFKACGSCTVVCSAEAQFEEGEAKGGFESRDQWTKFHTKCYIPYQRV